MGWTRQRLGAFLVWAADRLPPRLAARIDLMRPVMYAGFNGPLNGQRGRQSAIEDVAKRIQFAVVIETGTFRGTTTEYLANLTGAETFSVEVRAREFAFSQGRFQKNPRVHVVRGDSRKFLRTLAARPELTRATTLFYLDAHWSGDLPLREEMDVITAAWSDAVVVIDDFAVPDDDGYGFDSYGPHQALTLDYLGVPDGWTCLFPAMPSAEESGGRRGCVFVASESLAPAVRESPHLREHGARR